MFDDNNDARWRTLVSGLILLIVLAAVAAISTELDSAYHEFAQPDNTAFSSEMSDHLCRLGAMDTSDGIQDSAFAGQVSGERTYSTATGRLAPIVHHRAMVRMLDALGPIGVPMSPCVADDALVTYDLGISPGAAAEVLADLLESAVPDVHARFRALLQEFHLATGLNPTDDLLPHLGHGIAVGLLPPEVDLDGWPLPRKVVIMRVLDDEAVARYLEAWITWVAGSVAPMTQGVLGASIDSEVIGGFDLVGLRLDRLLPAQLPLPSPSYAVADGFLVVSPVRSAVAETLNRLGQGCSSMSDRYPDESVVEDVWLNLPAWRSAWQRAEPLIGSILSQIGVESPTTVQACKSLVDFLGEFEPAHGTTSLTPEGGLVFRIEMNPLR